MTTRLHSVLLTLWDIARGNPNYDRKVWGELQFLISDLDTRNTILYALMPDISAVDTMMSDHPPPIPTTLCGAVKRTSRNLGALEPTPQSDDERYDGVDESLEDSSEELIFDFGSTD